MQEKTWRTMEFIGELVLFFASIAFSAISFMNEDYGWFVLNIVSAFIFLAMIKSNWNKLKIIL
jgi:hypothetical protein